MKQHLRTLMMPLLLAGTTAAYAGVVPAPDWTFDVNQTNWTGYESNPAGNDSVTDPFDEWVLAFNSTSTYAADLSFVDVGHGIVTGWRPTDLPFDSEGINGDFAAAGNGEITFVWDDLTGYLTSDGAGGFLPVYTGGTIEMWYQSPQGPRSEATGAGYGDGTQIAALQLNGGGAVANLAEFTVELFGEVEWVLDGWLSFVEYGFGDFADYTNIGGDADADFVTWLFQFDAVATSFDPANSGISRREEGSGYFNVPTPAPLALIGLGLAALGWRQRRKAQLS